MINVSQQQEPRFRDAVDGLLRGDFTRLGEMLGDGSPIVAWFREGLFDPEPKALAEAFACACFLGWTDLAAFLLDHDVNPMAGDGTGMNGFHWAANRGNLATVEMLIRRGVPLETRNQYGGTVLGTTVWSAIHEPRPDHPAILKALIQAGASRDAIAFPTGNERVDELLQRLE
jgi:Ankyrin repeats (many copies)